MANLRLSHIDLAQIVAKYYDVESDKVNIIGNGASANVEVPFDAKQENNTDDNLNQIELIENMTVLGRLIGNAPYNGVNECYHVIEMQQLFDKFKKQVLKLLGRPGKLIFKESKIHESCD